MIKNIFDRENKEYRHRYYCDSCFTDITNGRIYRNEEAIKNNEFDLCYKCMLKWENVNDKKIFELTKEQKIKKIQNIIIPMCQAWVDNDKDLYAALNDKLYNLLEENIK